MKRNRFIIVLMFICNFSGMFSQVENLPTIIPAPVSSVKEKGFFFIDDLTLINIITNNVDINNQAEYLRDQIKTLTGLNLEVISMQGTVKNSINLDLGFASKSDEAYSLDISKKSVVIKGSSVAGIFYGIQSLLQLIPPGVSEDIEIPCLKIEDYPAYSWRGMHLDVCRHFFPASYIKKLLDQMAGLKLNTFHWHLTDDQGWRIEIKKYPRLTQVSSWRNETMAGHYSETNQKFDGIRYGGFYTQDEIKDIVAYAKSRYITIVPEIEMPGHAVAALAAYPEYSCAGGPFNVYTKWGISDDVFCAGKEGTFQFLQNILSEVMDLFPGKYIHIGGDECPKTRWKLCADCQARIKELDIKDETALQGYFVKRIERFVSSKGKKIIGWDEIQEGGLPERAAVMSWRGFEGGIEAAKNGHDVVMTPTEFCYFDYYQGLESNEPLAIGGLLPLENVYRFDPMPPSIGPVNAKHILGAQANVWTEYIPDQAQLEYMIFPRLCAMSEDLWTPVTLKDYPFFLYRLPKYLNRLKFFGINYRALEK